jgi:ribosomal-protein-alanine N-acetyltransferase
MTEALRALLGFSFEQLGVDKVFGECDHRNVASARVMEKAGMRRETTMRQEAAAPRHDAATAGVATAFRYAICRKEWQARQSP